jgi:thiamine-phosphate pyrophosphorylase
VNAPSWDGIYAVVDAASTAQPLALLESVLDAGIRVVQYRAKAGVSRDLVRAMHARTQRAGAWLIVNDDAEAALDADGLHVGQEDLAACDATALRAKLERRILGISCDTPALARAAQRLGADYVGVGPFAVTSTKADAGTPIGVAGLAAVVRESSLPVVAIGGISATNLGEVVASGAAMAAVVSAIAGAADPATAARALVAGWRRLRGG